MLEDFQTRQLAPSCLTPQSTRSAAARGGRSRGVAWCTAAVTLAGGLVWAGAAAAQDFSGQNLEGTVFGNVDFSGVDFSDADLTDVRFSGTDLTAANFSGANLTRTQFVGAIARGANFQFSTGDNPQFLTTDLRGANFVAVDWNQGRFQDGSDCSESTFSGASLPNLIMRDGAICDRANFTLTDFGRGPRFLNVFIRGSLFRNATLPNCIATNSDFTSTAFIDSDFFGCDFSGSEMEGVVFE
jgi:uncharacterized protein YjbI with pentapeptide repeats